MSSRRGQGMVYRPTYQDKKTGKKKQQKVWWVQYSIGGKRERESTGATVHREAVRFLHRRLAERGRGVSRRDLEKVTFEDLGALILADYKKNQRRSTDRLQRSLKHLRRAFGGWRVVDIGEDGIDRYAADRLDDGAAHATVHRELSALRRMFRLGARARLVGRVPTFDLLAEDNVRTGFLEEAEFTALLGKLPDYLVPLAVAGYVTGWRKSELLSREWRHLDLKAGWIRLDPGETKNREGRQFPLIPRLREAPERQVERRRKSSAGPATSSTPFSSATARASRSSPSARRGRRRVLARGGRDSSSTTCDGQRPATLSVRASPSGSPWTLPATEPGRSSTATPSWTRSYYLSKARN